MIKTGYEDYITLSFMNVCNPPNAAPVKVYKGEALIGKVHYLYEWCWEHYFIGDFIIKTLNYQFD
jgi:hypothetical protein